MKKNLILFVFSLVFLIGLTSAACCEQTDNGASCQDIANAANCDDNYQISENLACSSTTFCSAGTCVDRTRGECRPSNRIECDPNLGGYFYEQPIEEITECQKICCIINGPDYIEKVTCNSIGSEYNVQPEIIEGLSAQECYALEDADVLGSCVIQNELGRDCKMKTKSDCTGEFHKGILCTAQELGTRCLPSTTTACEPGKSEVYFKDTCGNTANIYDSSKIEPVNWDYWTYLKSIHDEELCGEDNGNLNSNNCGLCSYDKSTTCGIGNNADYGDYICRDIGCVTGDLADNFKDSNNFWGNYPKNGDSWCIDSFGEISNINDFENAVPGQTSFRASCFMGEIQIQLGDQYRNKLCASQKNEDTKKVNSIFFPNRWQDCIFQNNTDDCLNIDKRNCKVLEGANLRNVDKNYDFINSDTDKNITASCIPKYKPGLNFWEPKLDINSQGPGEERSSENVCNIGYSACGAAYSGEYEDLVTDWEWDAYNLDCVRQKDCMNKDPSAIVGSSDMEKCIESCGKSLCYGNEKSDDVPKNPVVKNSWINPLKNLCVNIGDCGVQENYQGKIGYNIWKDLFQGDINKNNL